MELREWCGKDDVKEGRNRMAVTAETYVQKIIRERRKCKTAGLRSNQYRYPEELMCADKNKA